MSKRSLPVTHWTPLGAALLLLLGAGCPAPTPTGPTTPTDPATPTTPTTPTDPNTPPAAGGPSAAAEIQGRSGSKLSGKATFVQQGSKVLVKVQVQGAPAGQHGVHIHEKGDCSAPDAKSAGGHFNPTGAPHGGPQAAAHHPGDFGNMTVGDDGNGTVELESDVLTVAEGQLSVVGKSIIIHEKLDDLQTQPTGNAGGRIGCGEIK